MRKGKLNCKVLKIIVFIIVCVSHSDAQKIIDLKDYGVEAYSFKNASPSIVKAIADASKYEETIIRFPEGRIDLWPDGTRNKEYYVSNATESDTLSKEKSIGILLENMTNVTLEGNKTFIVAHGKMIHIAIDNCKNIKVKGLSFDYERPTMSEMKILKADDAGVIAEVHRDSKYIIRNEKLIWYGDGWKAADVNTIRFDPRFEGMYYDSWKPFKNSKVTDLGNGKLMFKGDFSKADFKEGDIMTMRDTYRDCVGILNHYSKELLFEDIHLHYMHGMGVVSQFCENIVMNSINGQPRRASGRKIAAFADFLHFSGCHGKITVENSLFSGSHDDCINVHGTHLRIVNAEKNKIRVRFMHHQTWNIKAFDIGDTIGFVDNKTLLVYEKAQVKSVKKLSERAIELEIDRNVPKQLADKHCVENISKTPEVLIRNNRFEHTNTRGVLLTTRKKAVITGNIFYKTGMHAILIADDCNFWYESGPVKDVTISENKFIQCGYNSYPKSYAIAIMPETHDFEKDRFVHSNIKIIDNEFDISSPQVLFARSTNTLLFKGNVINEVLQDKFKVSTDPMFFLEHCQKVILDNNDLKNVNFQKDIYVNEMTKKDIKIKDSGDFTFN
ncbi:right-handed parallel beta-helix repeat-containing protein [Zhouia spongiae]|uniref:Right-handed parallel beta-helix repeat-containing protein n=1 Tax=Zhouia spongiae TaxID=2202721 RepID=A0ABY3YH25_9FLAO|nr:right-handed parallel beta-helix repeat-containing protein [Zhouia spongiae]UNY97234.1 right-handed parallel beta-helix repeat-containing protein [Zhouia spongiae]